MRISAPGDCNHAFRQSSGVFAVQKIAVVAYIMQQAANGAFEKVGPDDVGVAD